MDLETRLDKLLSMRQRGIYGPPRALLHFRTASDAGAIRLSFEDWPIMAGNGVRRWTIFMLCVFLIFLVTNCSSFTLSDGRGGYGASEQVGIDTQVHCSRPRSRTARFIIEEYLLPFLEQEHFNMSSKCRLNPENDMFRDQELQKDNLRPSQWQCGYCKKIFRTEDFVDKHMDNRHHEMLDLGPNRCIADVCGAIHCDYVDSVTHTNKKRKCNRAAVDKNKLLCENLANSCFPPQESATVMRLNEFFMRQFCSSHTCDKGQKHFPRGSGKPKNKALYMAFCLFTVILLLIFYLAVYLYRRDMSIDTTNLKRLAKHSILTSQKTKKF